MKRTFWIRGWTPLGLLNTVAAAVAGRVLVRYEDTETRQFMAWQWENAKDHPRGKA